VAELALDRPLRLVSPGELPWPEDARDTLALVRVHGEPIDLIFLPRPPGRLSPEELANEVWLRAHAAILRHSHSHGCGAPPSAPEEIIDSWPTATARDAAPPYDPGPISVVIASSRGGSQLARCLDSLERLGRPDLEVVVVGKEPGPGDTRSVVERAAKRLPGLRYISLRAGGTSVARNVGIASASSEIVALTDDDVVVDPAWLDRLSAPFASREVAMVTGIVLPLELTTRAQKWFELYAGFSKGLTPRIYDNDLHKANDRLLYPYWGAIYGSTNNMAFRRAELIALGGFDPALGGGTPACGGADMDVMTRIVLAGRTIAYDPRALVWHEHRRDEAALRRQLFAYGVGFTAALTKPALRDPRFLAAAIRSIPILANVIARDRRLAADPLQPRLPSELSRLERRGMVAGPRAYLRSAALARRSGPTSRSGSGGADDEA
jgi:GT2 family glycosyltransferase